MPFDPELAPGEELSYIESYQPGPKAEPFAFAVSKEALYLPAKKTFAVSDPYYLRRVPRHEVKRVSRQRIRATGLIVFGALLALFGAAVSYAMLSPILAGEGGKVSGIPFGMIVVGLVLPFVARGRHAIVVSLRSGSYTWKPPITIGGPVKAESRALMTRILEACNAVGLPTHDDALSD